MPAIVEQDRVGSNNGRRDLLGAIHHVAIIASDFSRSRRFYAEILGLPVIREVFREARGSWKCDLALGASQIELFSFPDPPPRPSRPEAQGLRHLAFSVDRLEPVIAHLEEHGIAVEPVRVDEHTGQRFTFFQDPDGLPLELYEKSSPSWPEGGILAEDE